AVHATLSLHRRSSDLALLAAVSAGAGRTFRRTRLVGATDAALLVIPLVAVAIYFVAIPGLDHGRPLLTVEARDRDEVDGHRHQRSEEHTSELQSRRDL